MEATDAVKFGQKQKRRDNTRRGFFRRVDIAMDNRAPIEARSFDISAEGVGVIIDVSLANSTSCTLTFHLPLASSDAGETLAIELRAVVIYSMLSGKMGGFKTGMKIIDPSEKVSDAIRSFLAA
jgi:hypothetical protein